MIVVSPNHHPEADKFWREKLGRKPNGARTLGSAQAKYLTDAMSPYYDMLITYASDYPFDIPKGAKRIAVMWHSNFPWMDGFKCWQRVNVRLIDYEVDYFVNEKPLLNLIKEVYPRAFYLPRFIDATKYPHTLCIKTIDTLWFGNKWNEFVFDFDTYIHSVKEPYWICHGEMGLGEKKIKPLNRMETLLTLAKAKKVWAIGVSQLEAQFYGCDIVSYRGGVLPFYDEVGIQKYVKRLMEEIN